MKFSFVKKGYSPEEVDDFISNLMAATEERLTAQYERLKELTRRNGELTDEINALKRKESSIDLALVEAIDKSREIEEATQRIYELELERLKCLESRWKNGLERVQRENASAIAVNEFEAVLKGVATEMEHMRSKLPKKHSPKAKTKAKGTTEASSSGFDLEEALNPTDSLKEICKKLGMI